jgi:osmotically inducible lipoprotein OsmB
VAVLVMVRDRVEDGRTEMRRIAVPLALAGVLAISGCQGMNADTGGRAAGGAAVGAAGGAVIGALTGNWGTGAAIGALAGSAGGLLYDQHEKAQGN